jgi:hypothetical protein
MLNKENLLNKISDHIIKHCIAKEPSDERNVFVYANQVFLDIIKNDIFEGVRWVKSNLAFDNEDEDIVIKMINGIRIKFVLDNELEYPVILINQIKQKEGIKNVNV